MRTPFQGNPFRVTFDDVTSGEKAPLGRILRNFRLRMRAPHPREPPFRVTSGSHVTCTTVLPVLHIVLLL